MNKKKVLLIIVLALLAGNLVAQSQYTIEHYTSENGLPQNSIKSISVDSYGFVWLATEDGLVRFDGHKFYIFNHTNLNIKSDRVGDIQPSSLDKPIAKEPIPEEGHRRICYAYYPEFHEWVRIENGTAIRDTNYARNWDYRSSDLSKGSRQLYLVNGLPDIRTQQSMNDQYLVRCGRRNGDFYLCDTNRISYYHEWKKVYEVKTPKVKLWHFFTLRERLFYFKDQSYFINVYNKKISYQVLTGDIIKNPLYKSKKAKVNLYWNNNSDQSFLTIGKYLYTLELQKEGNLVTKLLVEGFDLISNGIEQIYFDKKSNKVYLGSSTNGLFLLSKQAFQTHTIKGDNRLNAFYAHIPYSNDEILTPTGIIVGSNPSIHQTIERRLPILGKVNPTDKYVIIKDKSGTIWVRNHEYLIHLDRSEKKVIGFWKFKSEIMAIYQDKSSSIWVTSFDQGVYKIDPERPQKEPEPFGHESLKGITSLQAISERQLLVGTLSGLFKIDLFTKKPKLVEGTAGLTIKSILVINSDEIWISAKDKGLLFMDGKGNIIAFPLDRKKYLNSPHCVLIDSLGFLWIPTNRGLFQMAVRDLLLYAKSEITRIKNGTSSIEYPDLFYLYHSMEEGFKTNEFNGSCQPCAVKLPNGYISLPSMVGLVWFKPENITNYTPNGPIILDKVEINRKVVASQGDTLHFPANPENIRLFFTTPYAGNTYNLNLSYALVKQAEEARPSDWTPLDNDDFSIRYSSLKSGNYTLLIRKLDGFGVNKYTIKKVYILVEPLWYETAWAIAGSIILLLVSIYLYSTYRIRKIKHKNARLEELVTNRTQKLNSTLKELEESEIKMVEQVHIMSRLLASITHDIQSPLRYIALTSGSIPMMLQKGKLTDVASLGTVISDISAQMSTMLRDLLDYIKIQLYGKSMNFEAIDLRMLIDLKLTLFKPVVEQSGSEFINEVSPQAQVFSDYQLLSIVLHNLLDNAAKYTDHGMIRIYSPFHDDGEVELVISNPGSGISQEVIDIITSADKLENVNPTLKNNRSVGLGLLIAKEVADLLTVKLTVTQTDGINFHLFFKPQVQSDESVPTARSV